MSAALSLRGASPARAAWQSFANTMRWWSWCLMAALFIGVPAIGLLKSVEFAFGIFCGVTPILLLALWGLLVANALHQNHPTLARLLPQQPRRLRLNLVLVFLGVASGVGALQSVIPVPAAGVWVTLSLIFVAAAMRQPLLWATTALMGFAPLAPRYMSDDAWQMVKQTFGLLETPLGFLCLLAGGAAFLAALIKDGNDTHRAIYEKRQKQRSAVKAAMEGDIPEAASWFWSRTLRSYNRAFDKALTLAAEGRAGFRREMLALGLQAHISATGTGIAVLAIIMAIVLTSLWLGGIFQYKDAGQGVANSMYGLLGTLMGGVTQLHGSLIRRRHEQGLVALLPGVPRGAAFNRQLSLHLLRNFLTLWAGGSVVMGLMLSLLPGTGYAILSFVVVLLGGGVVLLRDWSRAGPFKGWTAFLFYIPLCALCMCARLALEKDVLSVASFLALSAVVLGALYAWRWRAVMRAPMAWPAARVG
ncbi:hypothetical protein ACFJGW_14760 [Burkholderiaceae bacterium UC74_6]